MTAPHILIIVENLSVPFDRRVWNEARTLKAAGYDVSIICPIGTVATDRYELLEGIEIYRHPLPLEALATFGYFAEYAVALYWELRLAIKIQRRKKIHAVQACNPPDLIFLVAIWFKLFTGAKFVFDHHDLNPELFEAKFNGRGLLYWVVRLFERLTFKCADMSIATNESYKRIAVERGHMPADKVFIVRSGPDLARMQIRPPNDEWKNGRRFLVAYVGVMGHQEGIQHLLEAAAHIVHTTGRHDIQFCLVGSGPEFEILQRLAVDLRITDYVKFTGRIPDTALVEVLNTADVCVNPDTVNPMNDMSTMNKIMEYMALGKPIVQFELKEGRYSARDASLYAEPNDVVDFAAKILFLIDRPDLRASMGEYGKKRVYDELAWKYEQPKLLAAYATLNLAPS